ncbi:hypothetical protein [Shewanella sp.]|uniref:hypothetical protein n=1 Tax=Shewanella sp. TaxID=50422 RepID=UPI003F3C626A
MALIWRARLAQQNAASAAFLLEKNMITPQLASKWLKLAQIMIVIAAAFGLYKLLTGDPCGIMIIIAALAFQYVNAALIWWLHK